MTARWNSLGTPASILPASGSLGAATGDPDVAARAWLRDHAGLFGMSAAAVDGLELVSSQKLAQSPARAVLFRQDFGGVAPALGGLVTVGVADGKVAYVSSSLARTTSAMPAAALTPLQGWLKAAADLSVGVAGAEVADITKTVSGGWTRLTVPGFAQEQQVRLRALPMADGTVRPVLEANVVNVAGGALARLHQPRRRRHRRGARPPQQVRELRLQQRLPGHGAARRAADPSTPSSSRTTSRAPSTRSPSASRPTTSSSSCSRATRC